MTTLHELAARERDRIKHWYCPNCGITHRSKGPQLARHKCNKIGLDLPLVEEGVKAFHVIHEREDYIGDYASSAARHPLHRNRIIINAHTEKLDGSYELTVFMPCAHL